MLFRCGEPRAGQRIDLQKDKVCTCIPVKSQKERPESLYYNTNCFKQKGRPKGVNLKVRYARGRKSPCDVVVSTAPSALVGSGSPWCKFDGPRVVHPVQSRFERSRNVLEDLSLVHRICTKGPDFRNPNSHRDSVSGRWGLMMMMFITICFSSL